MTGTKGIENRIEVMRTEVTLIMSTSIFPLHCDGFSYNVLKINSQLQTAVAAITRPILQMKECE